MKSALDKPSGHYRPPHDYLGAIGSPIQDHHHHPSSVQLLSPPSRTQVADDHSTSPRQRPNPRMTPSSPDLLAPKQPHFHLHRLCLVHLGAPPGASSITPQWAFSLRHDSFSDVECCVVGEHQTGACASPPFRSPLPVLEDPLMELLPPLPCPKPSGWLTPSDPVACIFRSSA